MKRNKILFLLSLCILLYWIAGYLINIYRFAVVGVVFEMLWLPMILALFILPVIAFIFWTKEKFVISSLNMFTIVIGVATMLILFFAK